jgi:Tol biopolymer transport system component
VRWFDLASGMGGPLPGLNRPDAQPISVSVDAKGSRIALVRSLDGRTELLLYNRNLASVRPLMLVPAGVPARVALSADGQQLAVQVSRGGRWEVEVMRVP